jgi:HSP20 family molecular chaperone IbpA
MTTELRKNTADSRAPIEKPRATEVRRLTPPVDIYENQEGFLIVADVPGVEADGLHLEYTPPELWVRAQRTNGGGEVVAYERRFELGSGVDPSSISAELKAGVLRIELKKSEALRPRKISVRAA